MLPLAANSVSASLAALVAGLMMVVVGVSKKRLQWRSVECPVCHRPRATCTCRWL